ncbi:MAG TPA: hypothetical protein VKB83_01395 [Nitrosopumilaceae archaeon]|nr:hypothetical protein [Nitrosopumilaceae archaeon]
MKKPVMLFFSVLLLSMMIFPLTANPSSALTVSGPIPIPSNLIPIPSTGTPIVPTLPDLGIVPIGLPAVALYSIDKIKSGLVASDPLNNEIKTQQELQANPGYWTYGGDAPLLNARYDFFKDTQGLHIGSQAPANGTWAGFYAASPNTNGMLFHSVITTPVNTIPYQWYENGMYVQTSQPLINYVTCASNTSAYGTVWAVVSTTGDVNQATQFNILWVDTSPNQPLTRDCAILTNGSNLLKVYLDGVMVYSSNNLNLQMPAPFNTYLEPQSSYPGQLLNGTYKDYYVTTGETIKVTNNPLLAATVKLVDPTGKVLASAPVNSGTAILNIGQFHMPLAAYIKVYDTLGIQLASTSSPVNIFGGDAYSVNPITSGLGLTLP